MPQSLPSAVLAVFFHSMPTQLCDLHHLGQIIEKKQEPPSADHPAFAALKKIDEAQARKIALEKYPGNIDEVEYEIETDGTATYEFEIKMVDGRKMEVEVDAATGKNCQSRGRLTSLIRGMRQAIDRNNAFYGLMINAIPLLPLKSKAIIYAYLRICEERLYVGYSKDRRP